MSEDELRKDFQSITNELQRFDDYGKQLQMQIETLQNYLIDLSRSKATLAGLKEETHPDETLIQLGSGIMLRVKPIQTDKVFYNVGSGVIVEKSIDDAIKEVDFRMDEVEKERVALADQLDQIINQINVMERKAQAIYQQLQGPSKPTYDPSLVS
ncbi:MAG: prefoldin subunit alpha [Candidatus Heimdallarchaeota archaeon]|nr:prefoldin subunit alpha [Candidatus Heimdallarchaeota archaeon]